MAETSTSNEPLKPAKLVFMAVAMFGFGYLLVPLYDVFCEVTGLGGRTNDAPVAVVEAPDFDRTVTLEFITTVNQQAPWDFRPQVNRMEVHPGKLYTAEFFARNGRDAGMLVQTVPNVAPSTAGKYLIKTDCFCFDQQSFGADEGRELLVRFIVDPDLPESVDTVTLSYTIFEVRELAAGEGAGADDEGST